MRDGSVRLGNRQRHEERPARLTDRNRRVVALPALILELQLFRLSRHELGNEILVSAAVKLLKLHIKGIDWMIDVLCIGSQDNHVARLADFDLLEEIRYRCKRYTDAEDAAHLAVLYDRTAKADDRVSVDGFERLRYDEFARLCRCIRVPCARPRIVARTKRARRHIAAIDISKDSVINAVESADLLHRRLHPCALGQPLLPVHCRRVDGNARRLDDRDDRIRVARSKLHHTSLLRCRQGVRRHRIDDESHDDEYDEKRHADPREHFSFQLHNEPPSPASMNTCTLCKYTLPLLLRQQQTNKANAHTTKRFPLYIFSFAIHATFSCSLLVEKSFILRLIGGGTMSL